MNTSISITRLRLVLVSVLWACEPTAPAAPAVEKRRKPTPTAESLTPKPAGAHRAGKLHYRLRHTGNATPGTKAKMVLAIHGLGDRPENFGHLFNNYRGDARIVLLQGPMRHGHGYSWFPISRRSIEADELAPSLRATTATIAETIPILVARHPTKGKPLVTGFSQGGMLSFVLATHYSDRIAGAVPLAGWLPDPLLPREKPHHTVPIVALHGTADKILPLAPTQRSVAALQGLGIKVELIEYPDVPHRLSAAMRARLYRALDTMVE